MNRLYFILCFLFIMSNINGQRLTLETFASGLEIPVSIAHANDDRLFVVEKRGFIKIVMPDGTVVSQDFLDIDDRVNSSANERGLLGLAFHPDFQNNGYFFVNYTKSNGATIVSRFSIDENGMGDPGSEMVLLDIPQPFSNHNGGCILFGPDGYLYIATGDGGAGGDPQNHGQNNMSYLGKMLRLDVDCCTPYGIPEDNPFQADDFTLDEIWATGLRNPWRFSFDRETGDMWIADVGQDEYEEVDFQAADSKGGENYGWKCWEGNDQFSTSNCGDPESYTYPIYTYETSGSGLGCSITGGYVYRGQDNPALRGYYVFADYCTGQLWTSKNYGCGGFETEVDIRGDFQNYSAFGEDANGELYLAGASTGEILKVNTQCSMTVSSVKENADCMNEQTGVIILDIEAADNFEIQWNNGVTTNVIDGLLPGCYCATVTDVNNGCQEVICEEILAVNPIEYEPTLVNSVSCGESVVINITNPFPDFDIIWHLNGNPIPGASGEALEITESGLYSIQFVNDVCTSDLYDYVEHLIVELEVPTITQEGAENILSAPAGFSLYYWYLDGVLIETSASNSLEVLEDGTYTVVVEDLAGCLSEASEGFLFETSNILDLETVENFKLFPNPFSQDLKLNINLSKAALISLEMIDATGKVILSKDFGTSKGFDFDLPGTELSSGVYFIKINIDQHSFLERVVKD